MNRGDQLYLRAHRPDGSPIEVSARVVRVAPAIYGTARIGVQILEPTDNWLRLFVSWVADEQTAAPVRFIISLSKAVGASESRCQESSRQKPFRRTACLLLTTFHLRSTSMVAIIRNAFSRAPRPRRAHYD